MAVATPPDGACRHEHWFEISQPVRGSMTQRYTDILPPGEPVPATRVCIDCGEQWEGTWIFGADVS